ncbi:MAG: Gfo/Idh/MocA family oxidoreductase [Blastocatellia bacterium]|nr:Gfo/Idh/MocA family oxidoreductase [Blastocatellia bacterium]
MLKVGVIGVGFLGRHHARIYSSLPNVQLVGVCDSNPAQGQVIAQEYNVPFYSDYQALCDQADAFSVAVPTIDHCRIACDLLARGKSVLVEKPISVTLAEADEMIATAQANGCVLQVGHLERYNPAVKAARTILNHPRFFEIHRMSIFTMRSLDIDVVTDLMIHDLDILTSLVQAPVASIQAVGIPILSSKIDIANARVEFANGCVANLTASRISSEKIRKIRFFQPHDYVSIDYTEQRVGVWSLRPPNVADARPQIAEQFLEVVKDEPLKLQLMDFVRSVETGETPEVDGPTGRYALELALRVVSEIKAHAVRSGLVKEPGLRTED